MKYTSCVECKRLIPEQRMYVSSNVGRPSIEASSSIYVGPANHSEIDGRIYCFACTKMMVAKFGMAEEVPEPVFNVE